MNFLDIIAAESTQNSCFVALIPSLVEATTEKMCFLGLAAAESTQNPPFARLIPFLTDVAPAKMLLLVVVEM
jgi:hypothetical protein